MIQIANPPGVCAPRRVLTKANLLRGQRWLNPVYVRFQTAASRTQRAAGVSRITGDGSNMATRSLGALCAAKCRDIYVRLFSITTATTVCHGPIQKAVMAMVKSGNTADGRWFPAPSANTHTVRHQLLNMTQHIHAETATKDAARNAICHGRPALKIWPTC